MGPSDLTVSYPHTSTERFFNQEDVIEMIKGSIGNQLSCLLIGGKWMGLTTILRRLYNDYRQEWRGTVDSRPIIPVLLDCRGSEDVRSLYTRLVEKTVLELQAFHTIVQVPIFRTEPDQWTDRLRLRHERGHSRPIHDLKNDLDHIFRHTEGRVRLLLLLDNAYLIDGGIRADAITEWLYLRNTREIGTDELLLVVADRPRLYDDVVTQADGYTHSIKEVFLHPFSFQDIYEMVSHYAPEGYGKDQDRIEKATHLVQHYSGGLPRLIKTIAEEPGIYQDIHHEQDPIFGERIFEWKRFYYRPISSDQQVFLNNSDVRKIIDRLKESPCSLLSLSSECQTAEPVFRWLRILTSCGIIFQSDELWCLNKQVSYYNDDNPDDTSYIWQQNLMRIVEQHPSWRNKSAVQRRAFLKTEDLPSEVVDDYQFDGTAGDTRVLVADLIERRGQSSSDWSDQFVNRLFQQSDQI